MSKKHWDFSGSRPGNHPKVRVQQAAKFLIHMRSLKFSSILHSEASEFIRLFSSKEFAGKQRTEILRTTVMLPALYLLGELFYKQHFIDFSQNAWMSASFNVPESILKPYVEAGLQRGLIKNNPGIVYQSRNFCKMRRCSECFVFKNAVRG